MVVEPFQYRNDPEQPLIAFLTIGAIGKPLNSDLSRRYPSNPVFFLYLFASADLSLALEVGDQKEGGIFDRISKDEILRWPSQATVSMSRGLRLLVAKSEDRRSISLTSSASNGRRGGRSWICVVSESMHAALRGDMVDKLGFAWTISHAIFRRVEPFGRQR